MPARPSKSPLENHLLGLFDEAPMWLFPEVLRSVQASRIPISSSYALKCALFSMSYCFKDGPFKGAFIRQDFDPRLSVDSARFQVFSFMESRETGLGAVEGKASRQTMIKDCRDAQVAEDLEKYIRDVKNGKFSVVSEEPVRVV